MAHHTRWPSRKALGRCAPIATNHRFLLVASLLLAAPFLASRRRQPDATNHAAMTRVKSSAPRCAERRAGGFGATPTPAPPAVDEDTLVKRRLGKSQRENPQRRELLRETTSQAFRVGHEEVSLLVPSYVLDYERFAYMVQLGVGTVSDIVWPAEQALSHVLLQQRHRWESNGVCELGAGLGLAGLVAAKAGAPQVLNTDRDRLTMEIAERSAALNGLGDVVSVASFDWEDKEDWPQGQYGLVVGADVLYDKTVVNPLVNLIMHLGGNAILMEPVNEERLMLGAIPYFENIAKANDLKVQVQDFVSPVDGTSPMKVVSVSLV